MPVEEESGYYLFIDYKKDGLYESHDCRASLVIMGTDDAGKRYAFPFLKFIFKYKILSQ